MGRQVVGPLGTARRQPPCTAREMAMKAVKDHTVSVALACRMFGVSETCYRYWRKLDSDNEEIADWLLRLTTTHKTWGFGLCFLYLRNIKGFGWNHKRVYRIYRELELNLRIKPGTVWYGSAPSHWLCPSSPAGPGRWTSWPTS